MTWLLFLDESGHDHKAMPFEVRGGVALHVSKLWNFIQGWGRLEQDAFGVELRSYGKEAKGFKLLDKDRIRWAGQSTPFPAAERRKNVRGFLEKGRSRESPTSSEFAAYGQACLEMARGIFDLLFAHEARLFACVIPKGARPPADFQFGEYLRKDHVYLFERYFYFLEKEAQHGLIIMDESKKNLDRKFVNRMESYFTRTGTGRNRTYWIVPAPLFVSSDMSYAVQAADVCLYVLNWGFRLPAWGSHDSRQEIAAEFGQKIARLQWSGDGYRDGKVFRSFGVVYVPDPYG